MATRRQHDHGDRWDEEDVRLLLEFVAEHDTLAEAARGLGRTRAACASKLYRLRRAER
jgi:hypothetical protein